MWEGARHAGAMVTESCMGAMLLLPGAVLAELVAEARTPVRADIESVQRWVGRAAVMWTREVGGGGTELAASRAGMAPGEGVGVGVSVSVCWQRDGVDGWMDGWMGGLHALHGEPHGEGKSLWPGWVNGSH